jgi:hypothetical protein
MVIALFQFFPATPNGPAIYLGHGLKESRVEFHGMFRFGDPKFGNRRIEGHLQALQKNGVIDSALLPSPRKNPVS